MSARIVGFWLGGMFLLIFALVSGARLIRRTEAEADKRRDNLIIQLLAKALSRHLGRSPASLVELLRGRSGDGRLRAEIERLLRVVNVTYKLSENGREVELNVEARDGDGDSFAASTRQAWEELPHDIRAEFLQSGERLLTRPWQLRSAVH